MSGRIKGYRHDANTRNKIQASALINRLHEIAMGTVEASAQQVNAAKSLLNKVLPDLSSIEMQATVENVTEPTELSTEELLNIAATGSTRDSEAQSSAGEPSSIH